jgi:hypothetical protein
METAHEPLHLGKWILVQWNIMNISTSSILIYFLFNEAFKFGDGAKFWDYVGTNAKPLCVKFCNFVQYDTHCKLFNLLLLNLT